MKKKVGMRVKLDRVVSELERHDRILVTSHQDPDGDSVGSQLALLDLLDWMGKKWVAVNQGEIPSKFNFLGCSGRIGSAPEPLPFEPELVVVVECPSLERTGFVRELMGTEAKILNIDHHRDNGEFGHLNLIDLGASAVGEIIYDLLMTAGFEIGPATAERLYAAILTDTGRFRYSNTTPRCLNVCADLMRRGADPKRVTDNIYYMHDRAEIYLLADALSRMELLHNGEICLVAISRKDLERFGVSMANTEGMIDYTMYLKGVEIGVLVKEMDDGVTKASLRSQDTLNLLPFVGKFGGGGHRNAAGCTIDAGFEEAKEIVKAELEKYLDAQRSNDAGE